jgi:hypothetical protein
VEVLDATTVVDTHLCVLHVRGGWMTRDNRVVVSVFTFHDNSKLPGLNRGFY